MPIFEKEPDIKVKYVPMTSISLETLKDIRENLNAIQTRIERLEKIIEERIPKKALSEDAFKEELQSTEEIVDMIVSKLKGLQLNVGKTVDAGTFQTSVEISAPNEQNLTIVERKRIEKIKSFLQQHEQLTSTQLAQLMNLSRTRCNEYFKRMENLGMVEPILIGKEKFYRLS